MANSSLDRQVDVTVKLLVTLLADPRIKADELAKALGKSRNYIATMLMRFRDAGLDVNYNFQTGQYDVRLEEKLQKSLLGKYASKLRHIINAAERTQPQKVFVSTLNRYTVAQWAEAHGMTPANVSNMIGGYKGAKLPVGWVAYQLIPRGKWLIQKMPTDRAGGKHTLPETAKEAHKVVIGEGPARSAKQRQARNSKCLVRKCDAQPFVKGFCNLHYYQQLRHPERFAEYLSKTA